MRFVSRRWGYISELSDQMELTGFMILRNLLYQANLDGSSAGIVLLQITLKHTPLAFLNEHCQGIIQHC